MLSRGRRNDNLARLGVVCLLLRGIISLEFRPFSFPLYMQDMEINSVPDQKYPILVLARSPDLESEFISFGYWTSPPAALDRRVFPLMT